MSTETDSREQKSFQNEGTNSLSPENQKNYKNAREYAQDLQSWLWQYRMWSSFCAFQSQVLASLPPPTFTQTTNSSPQGFSATLPRSTSTSTDVRDGQQEVPDTGECHVISLTLFYNSL